jgi:hypothetical protein
MNSLFWSVYCLIVFGALFNIVLLILAQCEHEIISGLSAAVLFNGTVWLIAYSINRKKYPRLTTANVLWATVIFFMCGDITLGTVTLNLLAGV